jgi:hypothetical protein
MLKRAARPKRRRAIVCYDAKWAGLPRITIYDPPSGRKAGGRRRALPVRPTRIARVEQLSLPL